MTYSCTLKYGMVGTATILLLGACASDPSACDPRKGGFIAGLSAMGSGCYEKRIEEKQEKLSSAQSLTERLQSENRALKTQKGSTARQKSQIQGRTSRATGNKPASVSPTKQADVARKEREMQALKAKISATKQSQQGDSEEVKQLERELKKAAEERDRMARDAAESMVH